jgi:hypothetical protein
MSILVVHVVPQGVLFTADRNVTTTIGAQTVYIGQAQRLKVLKWPSGDALIGYVGQASIGNTMTDEWLLSFIGRHPTWPDFATMGNALTADLNTSLAAGEIASSCGDEPNRPVRDPSVSSAATSVTVPADGARPGAIRFSAAGSRCPREGMTCLTGTVTWSGRNPGELAISAPETRAAGASASAWLSSGGAGGGLSRIPRR